MAVTAADVKALFPELAAVADDRVTTWLSFASIKHNVSAFGARSDNALKCLAAHLVELERRRAAGGTGSTGLVQSRTVGDVATTYAVPILTADAMGDAALASTSYGQLYLDLRGGVFVDRTI